MHVEIHARWCTKWRRRGVNCSSTVPSSPPQSSNSLSPVLALGRAYIRWNSLPLEIYYPKHTVYLPWSIDSPVWQRDRGKFHQLIATLTRCACARVRIVNCKFFDPYRFLFLLWEIFDIICTHWPFLPITSLSKLNPITCRSDRPTTNSVREVFDKRWNWDLSGLLTKSRRRKFQMKEKGGATFVSTFCEINLWNCTKILGRKLQRSVTKTTRTSRNGWSLRNA